MPTYNNLPDKGQRAFEYILKTNVTVGSRNDGWIRFEKIDNRLIIVECRLIGSGNTSYTITNLIPEGYRPLSLHITPLTGSQSQTPNLYGYMAFNMDGTVDIHTSSTAAASLYAYCMWYTD